MKSALIVEDHEPSQRFFSEIVEATFPGISVDTVATLEDAERRIVANSYYNLALVDLSLPDGSGVDLISIISEQCPETYCLVITIFDDDRHILAAIKAGARGYVLKDQSREDLINRFKGIAKGEPPVSPTVLRRLFRYLRTDNPRGETQTRLTAREQEVLTLMAKGLSRKEIAVALTMRDNTAAGHIKSIYKKLNVSSRAEATLEAVRFGLVNAV